MIRETDDRLDRCHAISGYADVTACLPPAFVTQRQDRVGLSQRSSLFEVFLCIALLGLNLKAYAGYWWRR